MIEEAKKRGALQAGMSVVKYTGGSTGSQLALICAIKGYHFRVVSSDAYSQERLRNMESLGAELEIEVTVDYARRRCRAKVVKTPFFNPERKQALVAGAPDADSLAADSPAGDSPAGDSSVTGGLNDDSPPDQATNTVEEG